MLFWEEEAKEKGEDGEGAGAMEDGESLVGLDGIIELMLKLERLTCSDFPPPAAAVEMSVASAIRNSFLLAD